MINKILVFYFLFISVIVFSQEREILKGKVVTGSIGAKDVLVVNLISEREIRTDSLGSFSIKAKINDTLVVFDASIELKKIIITEQLLKNQPFIINVVSDAYELAEVVINYQKIDLKAMGIDAARINKDIVPKHGNMDFVAIYKLLSGRKKEKKEADVKYIDETFIAAIQHHFPSEFFIKTLQIPQEEIGLFLHFCDDGRLVRELLDQSKKFELTDYLVSKSKQYHKLKE